MKNVTLIPSADTQCDIYCVAPEGWLKVQVFLRPEGVHVDLVTKQKEKVGSTYHFWDGRKIDFPTTAQEFFDSLEADQQIYILEMALQNAEQRLRKTVSIDPLVDLNEQEIQKLFDVIAGYMYSE